MWPDWGHAVQAIFHTLFVRGICFLLFFILFHSDGIVTLECVLLNLTSALSKDNTVNVVYNKIFFSFCLKNKQTKRLSTRAYNYGAALNRMGSSLPYFSK